MHTAYVFTKEAVPLLCRNLSKKPEYLQGDSIREAFLQKLFSRRLASSTFKLNGRFLHSPSNSCPKAKNSPVCLHPASGSIMLLNMQSNLL